MTFKKNISWRYLRQVQTDGINYDIDNDSLISIIRQFDTRYSLSLRGAGGDWCEFEIGQPSPNWMQMAYEAYLACPDIVDQGSGTVEKLADEMETNEAFVFLVGNQLRLKAPLLTGNYP